MESLTIPYPTTSLCQPIHIKMMDTVLSHRLIQIKHLSSHRVHFDAFSCRLAEIVNADVDGQYSEFLLKRKGKGNVAEVGRHYVALMYRSVDERLSRKDRLHSVKCVRESSRLLKEFLGKLERRENLDDGHSNMDEVMDIDKESKNDGHQKKRRSVGMAVADGTAEGNSKKRSRKDSELQTKGKENGKTLESKNDEGEGREDVMTAKETPGPDDARHVTTEPSSDKTVQDKLSTRINTSKPTSENKNMSSTNLKDTEKSIAPVERSASNMQVSISSTIEKITSPNLTNTTIEIPKDISTPPVESSGIGDKVDAVQDKTVPTAQQLQANSAKETQKPSTEMPDAQVQQAKPSSTQEVEANNITVPFLAYTSSISQSTNHRDAESNKCDDQTTYESPAACNTPGVSGSEKLPAPQEVEANNVTVPFLAYTSTISQSTNHRDAESNKRNDQTTYESPSACYTRGSSVSDIEFAKTPSAQSATSRSFTSKMMSADAEISKNIQKDSDAEKNTTKSAVRSDSIAARSFGSSKPYNRKTNSNLSLSSGATSAFQPINSNAAATTTVDRDEASRSKESREMLFSTQQHQETNQSSCDTSKNKENKTLTASIQQNKTASKSGNEASNKKKNNENHARASSEGATDHGIIIDLITPPGTPRATSPPQIEPPKTVENETLQAPCATIKQLPPSPEPITKILVPLPDPYPDPRPFHKTNSVTFLADDQIPYQSGSLHARTSNMYSYDAGYHADGSGACLEHTTYLDVQNRLSTWEPYWRIVEDVGLHSVKASESGHTFVGNRTAACLPQFPNANSSSVNSCARLTLNLPSCKEKSRASVKWGQFANPNGIGSRIRDQYRTGDTRLILRTLPLHRSAKEQKKRADTHIWPKGTLIQLAHCSGGGSLNDDKIIPIFQRRQERHDESSWKGMSHMLDLTRYSNSQQALSVKLCTAEVIESTSGGTEGLVGSYALHASICEYVSPDDLYDKLMGKKSGGDVLIPTLSERSAKILAMDYVASQTVALEDSDDEDAQNTPSKEINSLTLSLLCPMKKMPIETPVRGRNCKHLQCFDLRYFLQTNEVVSGGRWRCVNCENFISVRDLVHCGLFQTMIDKYQGCISGARDKVSLQSDGSFYLKDENRLRYANKRASATSKAGDSAEVIDLD